MVLEECKSQTTSCQISPNE